jgi:hypothetical protein
MKCPGVGYEIKCLRVVQVSFLVRATFVSRISKPPQGKQLLSSHRSWRFNIPVLPPLLPISIGENYERQAFVLFQWVLDCAV